MAIKYFRIPARNVETRALNTLSVALEFDAESEDVLNYFTVKDFLDRIGEDEFLDEIGVEYTMKYFNLKREDE